jgi:hypothetical protein
MCIMYAVDACEQGRVTLVENATVYCMRPIGKDTAVLCLVRYKENGKLRKMRLRDIADLSICLNQSL